MHICMCPVGRVSLTKPFQRDTIGKVSSRQFQRYVNGFYPKSDVEVTAFQSFWYEFADKHKVCIFCMSLKGMVLLTKPSQRDTNRKLSLRQF